MSLPSPAALLGALAGVDLRLVVLAVLVNVAGIWLRAEAWRGLVRHACRAEVRSRDTFAAYVVALVGNAFLPARAGEVARIGLLARRVPAAEGVHVRVAGTVVAQRLLDAVPFAALVLLGVGLAGSAVAGLPLTAAIVGGIGVVVAAAVLVARRSGAGLARRGRVGRALEGLRAGLAGLADPRVTIRALALETSAWIAQVAVVWLALAGFGIPPSIGAAVLTLIAINLAAAIPLTPGGVGLFQAATALSLGVGGVAAATGVAFGVGLQAIELLTTALVAVPVLAREGVRLGRLIPFRRRAAREAGVPASSLGTPLTGG